MKKKILKYSGVLLASVALVFGGCRIYNLTVKKSTEGTSVQVDSAFVEQPKNYAL